MDGFRFEAKLDANKIGWPLETSQPTQCTWSMPGRFEADLNSVSHCFCFWHSPFTPASPSFFFSLFASSFAFSQAISSWFFSFSPSYVPSSPLYFTLFPTLCLPLCSFKFTLSPILPNPSFLFYRPFVISSAYVSCRILMVWPVSKISRPCLCVLQSRPSMDFLGIYTLTQLSNFFVQNMFKMIFNPFCKNVLIAYCNKCNSSSWHQPQNKGAFRMSCN